MNNKKVVFICLKTVYNMICFLVLWVIAGFTLVGIVNAEAGDIYKVSYIDYAFSALIAIFFIVVVYCIASPVKKEKQYSKRIHNCICVSSLIGITLIEIPFLPKTVAMILSDINHLTSLWYVSILAFLIAYRIIIEIYSAHPHWIEDSNDDFHEETGCQ